METTENETIRPSLGVGMFNINHIYIVIKNTDVFNKPGSIKCVFV